MRKVHCYGVTLHHVNEPRKRKSWCLKQRTEADVQRLETASEDYLGSYYFPAADFILRASGIPAFVSNETTVL